MQSSENRSIIILEKIISGGQTGADRAALDWAMRYGIETGGWCPKKRKAEDGKISAKYNLIETESATYRERTGLNVRDSDGTIILFRGKQGKGTKLTGNFCKELNKPCIEIDMNLPIDLEKITRWITENKIRVLNVAGNRESTSPGIYDQTFSFLNKLFKMK